jgi:secondary thiamine-phosphate synthase enzyme
MRLATTDIELAPRPRGVHLVTDEIVSAVDLGGAEAGLLHLFLRHTSAGLLLTENASPEVRRDLDRWLRDAVPDGWAPFEHTLEGPDDMPAHVGSALFGVSLTLPVREGRLALGTWQGIALAELRERGGPRRVAATLTAV